MKVYDISINIHAPVETIWDILTNGAAYPVWNSTVEKVEGYIREGEKIKVFATISPNRAFPVKVTEFTPTTRMVWHGGMPLGLFKGVRTFTLTPVADGTVEFRMHEKFSGLLSALIIPTMPDLTESFQQFAKDLKQKSEGQ